MEDLTMEKIRCTRNEMHEILTKAVSDCYAGKMTMQEYRKFKAEIQEFVMKRAFLIVIASFYDTADLKWRDYFKSKKKKDEFL